MSGSGIPRAPHQGRIRGLLQYGAATILFLLMVAHYVAPEELQPWKLSWRANVLQTTLQDTLRQVSLGYTCPLGTPVLKHVYGGFICDDSSPSAGLERRIFETYPISGKSRAEIMPDAIQSNDAAADALLKWQLAIPRATIWQGNANTDWTRVPGFGPYWVFYMDSLRPAIAALRRYEQTDDPTYLDRLWSLVNSYLNDSDERTSRSWSDPHAVAFRMIALNDIWWTLREYHVLAPEDSQRLLEEIEKGARYLNEEYFFQSGMNHGPNEAAALLSIAVSFPDLPAASTWRATATRRLEEAVRHLIEPDGGIIESSPYYQMYSLEKMWEIQKYCRRNGVDLSSQYTATLAKMVEYATYVLQPDRSAPLLGASLYAVYNDNRAFLDMSRAFPEFSYVLSAGNRGVRPKEISKDFGQSGLTIFRSRWGTKRDYDQPTHVTFLHGTPKTNHSQRDELGVTLYSRGAVLIPPSGLYTYDESNPKFSYYMGTSSHNTVVVDGRDQRKDEGQATSLQQRDGVASQSASTRADDGVEHRRNVTLIDERHLLVVDDLVSTSGDSHTFDQTWHADPSATVVARRGAASVTMPRPDQSFTIRQIGGGLVMPSVREGSVSPMAGWCSKVYEVDQPCPQISFRQVGMRARFVTLITIGSEPDRESIAYNAETKTLSAVTASRRLGLRLDDSVPETEVAASPKGPDTFDSSLTLKKRAGATSLAQFRGAGLQISPRGCGCIRIGDRDGYASVMASQAIDLSRRTLQVTFRLVNRLRLQGATLGVSSDAGRTWATVSLDVADHRSWGSGWTAVSLPRAAVDATRSDVGGARWTVLPGTRIDWAHIDRLRISVSGRRGAHWGSIDVQSISTVPEHGGTEKSAVVFVFDDGYTSILPAVKMMSRAGLKGNVALIGKCLQAPCSGNLTVEQARHLQDDYGWNMVNHSMYHVDAVKSYVGPSSSVAYGRDVARGRAELIATGLNSAPNWFIYPHGATNDRLMAEVSKLYPFARTTMPGDEIFPFADPLRVRTFELHYPRDSSEGGGVNARLTPASEVLKAVREVQSYGGVLFVTGHRFEVGDPNHAGYPLAEFQKIVNGVKRSGVTVMTLSELDGMNGMIARPSAGAVEATYGQIVPVFVDLEDRQKSGLLARLVSIF